MRIHISKVYSFFVLSIAFSIAGNAQMIKCGDIDINSAIVANYFRSPDSSQGYVELNDGKKIYGNNLAVDIYSVKKNIKIGDTVLRFKDTRGYFAGGEYYARAGGTYAKRYVTGKINIYWTDYRFDYDQTTFKGKTHTYTASGCIYYAQKGDSAELISLDTFKDLKEVVKDCPKSLAMINKSDKDIRKAIKENPHYLKEIISIYNDNCK
jgi:hypothetical protein